MLVRGSSTGTQSYAASISVSRNIRTLVADDSPSLLDAVCDVLEIEQLAQVVGRANDGVEAVQLTATLKPDLLLMDISMPNMNGLEAAALVRSTSPATRIILMSGEETPQMQALALAAGADGFLFKTSFPEEFVYLLEHIYSDAQ